MNINSINWMQLSKKYFDVQKKQGNSAPAAQIDRVTLSSQAKIQQTAASLREIVEKYLERSPSIREEKVEAAAEKIRQGYNFDSAIMSVIADRIQENLRTFG